MKIVSLLQGSAEWLEWRFRMIMATDASVIAGTNPFKTPFELYLEKMDGITTPSNDAMRRGQELEPIARALFIEETGIHVEPAVIESSEFHWMGASLDGIDATRKIIVEIKAPKLKTHLSTIDNIIPEYYETQMIHQLICSNADICYYVSYHPDCNNKLIIQERFLNKMALEGLVSQEKAFYECMCLNRPPEKPWTLKGKNE